VERKLAAVLSADAVGYSRLMAEDEAATIRTLTSYREQIGVLVREHRGRVVDAPGDNLLAEFPTALEAVRSALEIQRVLRARNADLPQERRMDFRIGVHMGDVAAEGERIYGDGVNIAARLEALAEAGGVCISATVHEQVRNKLDVGFTDLGDQTVKNIPDPIRVYRVRPRGQSESPARAKATPGKRPRRLRTALAVTAAVLLLLGLGLWASWPRPLGLLIDLAGVSGPPVDPALPDKPSIVVLPFVNMSDDPEQEYFSDGITEQLTADLSRNPALFVISRNSAFTYKGKPVKVADVGRELGVRYVLEGSVRKAGDRVRITAQLIDATRGHHVWSEQYDGDLADIFVLQSKISEEITTALGSKLRWAQLERARAQPTENLRAHDAVLRGYFHLNRANRKDNAEARRWFERASELDPDYAGAYAALGNTYISEYVYGWNNLDPASLDRGEELVRRALELDSFIPGAHAGVAIVNLHRGRSREAVAAAETAVELLPNWAPFHAILGLALAQDGRIAPALRAIKRALRLNPKASSATLLSVAYVNLAAGRRQEAEALLERARLSNPDNIIARVTLAAVYAYEGRHEEARVAAQEALRVNPDLTVEVATRLIQGLGQVLEPEEAAQLGENLRKAGLP
jgi:adenylate cyclase